jgi:hypothetical protein
MKLCAFCPEEAVEKGGEHVWDNWLNKELPKTRYRARKRLSLESALIQYDTCRLDEKLPVVCERCNCGWMSALTREVKDRFSMAMLNGEPFSLGDRDAAVLAAFTFMKAVVTDHTIDHEPFFSRAVRERFRNDLIIAPATKMWFAAFQSEYRISLKNNLGIIDARRGSGPLYGLEFCSYSCVIGHLVIQLLAPRWKRIVDRGRPLVSLTPNAYWEQGTTLFWPHRGELLLWPPKKLLGYNTIQGFIHRFSSPVNLIPTS